MSADPFDSVLNDLVARIDTLPAAQREPLLDLVAETRQRHDQIRRSTERAQADLDDWRIAQKYQIFDAECRERERATNGSQPPDHPTE
ncbi:MAG: hypothetical protein GY778_22205 [bacterium]|nr:hypothetical protein [bacterium]